MLTQTSPVQTISPAAQTRRAWGILAMIWGGLSALILMPGDVVLTSHWADALHLVDILDRMAQGQHPHLDFVTPLGAWAFAPIVALMAVGLPTGMAYLITQVLLAGVLGAAGMAIAQRRMGWIWALVFAAMIMITVLALVHGRPEFSLSVNVHYNRWGWAIGLVALLAALLAPDRASPWEGVFIGAALAGLAMIKITYFAAFLPLASLGLIATGQIRSLIIAGVTGLGLAVLLTLLWGPDYWQAYLGDLLYVAHAGGRPHAGNGLISMIADPQMLAPTVLTGAAVVLLFQGGLQRQGLLLLGTFLAGAYVSDQNAGHDPFFLGLAALLVLVWAQSFSDRKHMGLKMISLGLVVAIAPNIFNLTSSPLRAALMDRSGQVPLVIGAERHGDILLDRFAANAGGQMHLVSDGQQYFYGVEPPAQLTFLGEVLPDCQSQISPSYFASLAADLAARDLAQGQTVFVADYLSPLWLFGDHPALRGAAPWSYGGLHGIENADFLLIPTCPNRVPVQRSMLPALEEYPMTEVVRTPLYRLYAL